MLSEFLQNYSCGKAFQHSSGPREAKIALVGEAWGDEEERVGIPFIGASGQELTRMLRDAGIAREDCFLTNTFAFRPPEKNIEWLCGKKAEVGKNYSRKEIKQGKYILPRFFKELDRLEEELQVVKPNVIIVLGAIACWALLNSAKIGVLRGAVQVDPFGTKVLPTYHPAGVLRNWSWREIVVADLMKGKRHSAARGFSRINRKLVIHPTIEEVVFNGTFFYKNAKWLAIDIETWKGQIEMISFARGNDSALVIPFIRGDRKSYWENSWDEVTAWKIVRLLCEAEGIEKIFQNGLFDLQYLWKAGIRVRNCKHDTMILHHSLFPEMQKGLGFMGSLYTDFPAWKELRDGGEEMKREE